MVMLRPSKPTTWVRFPSPAPFNEKTVSQAQETVFSFPPRENTKEDSAFLIGCAESAVRDYPQARDSGE